MCYMFFLSLSFYVSTFLSPLTHPNQTGETQSRENRIEPFTSHFRGHLATITDVSVGCLVSCVFMFILSCRFVALTLSETSSGHSRAIHEPLSSHLRVIYESFTSTLAIFTWSFSLYFVLFSWLVPSLTLALTVGSPSVDRRDWKVIYLVLFGLY